MKRVALCVGINDYGVDHSLQGASPAAVAIDADGWIWMTPIGKTQYNIFR